MSKVKTVKFRDVWKDVKDVKNHLPAMPKSKHEHKIGTVMGKKIVYKRKVKKKFRWNI